MDHEEGVYSAGRAWRREEREDDWNKPSRGDQRSPNSYGDDDRERDRRDRRDSDSDRDYERERDRDRDYDHERDREHDRDRDRGRDRDHDHDRARPRENAGREISIWVGNLPRMYPESEVRKLLPGFNIKRVHMRNTTTSKHAWAIIYLDAVDPHEGNRAARVLSDTRVEGLYLQVSRRAPHGNHQAPEPRISEAERERQREIDAEREREREREARDRQRQQEREREKEREWERARTQDRDRDRDRDRDTHSRGRDEHYERSREDPHIWERDRRERARERVTPLRTPRPTAAAAPPLREVRREVGMTAGGNRVVARQVFLPAPNPKHMPTKCVTVVGLRKDYNRHKIGAHFAKAGEVTHVRRGPWDGQAWIGYRRAVDATRAYKAFGRSMYEGNQIKVYDEAWFCANILRLPQTDKQHNELCGAVLTPHVAANELLSPRVPPTPSSTMGASVGSQFEAMSMDDDRPPLPPDPHPDDTFNVNAQEEVAEENEEEEPAKMDTSDPMVDETEPAIPAVLPALDILTPEDLAVLMGEIDGHLIVGPVPMALTELRNRLSLDALSLLTTSYGTAHTFFEVFNALYTLFPASGTHPAEVAWAEDCPVSLAGKLKSSNRPRLVVLPNEGHSYTAAGAVWQEYAIATLHRSQPKPPIAGMLEGVVTTSTTTAGDATAAASTSTTATSMTIDQPAPGDVSVRFKAVQDEIPLPQVLCVGVGVTVPEADWAKLLLPHGPLERLTIFPEGYAVALFFDVADAIKAQKGLTKQAHGPNDGRLWASYGKATRHLFLSTSIQPPLDERAVRKLFDAKFHHVTAVRLLSAQPAIYVISFEFVEAATACFVTTKSGHFGAWAVLFVTDENDSCPWEFGSPEALTFAKTQADMITTSEAGRRRALPPPPCIAAGRWVTGPYQGQAAVDRTKPPAPPVAPAAPTPAAPAPSAEAPSGPPSTTPAQPPVPPGVASKASDPASKPAVSESGATRLTNGQVSTVSPVMTGKPLGAAPQQPLPPQPQPMDVTYSYYGDSPQSGRPAQGFPPYVAGGQQHAPFPPPAYGSAPLISPRTPSTQPTPPMPLQPGQPSMRDPRRKF